MVYILCLSGHNEQSSEKDYVKRKEYGRSPFQGIDWMYHNFNGEKIDLIS